jgi:hypothetical protein
MFRERAGVDAGSRSVGGVENLMKYDDAGSYVVPKQQIK